MANESGGAGGLPPYVCPAGHGELVADAGALRCRQCGASAPVVNGIPRFVASDGYADSFGAQWTRWRATQLDSTLGLPLARDRLRRCLGDALWAGLGNAAVLEVGCGAGRFTEVLLSEGASVASVDLSGAVEANARTCPVDDTRHHVAQADVMALPFPAGQFDIVLCLGVLQHTASPDRTIEALVRQVRAGGWVVCDHYTWSIGWVLKPTWAVRQVVRRLPPGTALHVTERIVGAFWPLHRRTARGSRWLRSLVSRISPVVLPPNVPGDLGDRDLRTWAVLETHDAVSDYYRHLRTRRQLQRALERVGLHDIWCRKGGNGIEARGRRPVPARHAAPASLGGSD
jgi:2-polyprenyl-3-methyl-5-hydroxy-6-metoxy-1,4-benzoquinol methylase